MAQVEKLMPFIQKWEGGFVNHPKDKGGPTNKGVTLGTFRSLYGKEKTVADLKAMTGTQWLRIFRNMYWDKCRADGINNQSVANIIVDWAWISGPRLVTKKVQGMLGLVQDGVFGPVTLAAVNAQNPKALFDSLKMARISHANDIVKADPSQKVFLNGWCNRVVALKFES